MSDEIKIKKPSKVKKCCLFLIIMIVLTGVVQVFLYPQTRVDDSELSENDWILYYEKKTNNVFQVYSFDGVTENNLVDDPTHNYWWIKVNDAQTKYLCYRTPLGAGSNSYHTAELMTFDIDGSNGQVIVSLDDYDWQMQGVAKWSPDGNYILLAAFCNDSSRGDEEYRWRLIVVDSNGQNPHVISPNPWVYADPNWSPDGSQIVYVSAPNAAKALDNNNFEIYVADFDAINWNLTNPVRLTNDALYCFDPAWSPDGNWIAYSTGQFLLTPWDIDIVKCRPDGSDKAVIMDDLRSNGVPWWTPDNSRIVFHTLGLWQSFSIASCDAVNGGDKTILLTSGISEYATPSIFTNIFN